MKRINTLTSTAEDYPTRLEVARQCYGEDPTPPPPIEPGCTVIMNKMVAESNGNLQKFEGIVTRMDGDLCQVMWLNTDNNGVIRKREDMSLDDQKKYLGWPGFAPIVNTEMPISINKKDLTLKFSCGDKISLCKKKPLYAIAVIIPEVTTGVSTYGEISDSP